MGSFTKLSTKASVTLFLLFGSALQVIAVIQYTCRLTATPDSVTLLELPASLFIDLASHGSKRLLYDFISCSQSPARTSRHKAVPLKGASLQILPCTVSQLLSASQVSTDSFAICDMELKQLSVLGIIRECSPFVTNVQYLLDDMTGPPLNVNQWVNSEDGAMTTFIPSGTYVKVIGSLRNVNRERSLFAMDMRCIKDLNEITSHMLEVVHAHMQLFGKGFDVNMNITAASGSGRHPEGSTIQSQVLLVIRRFPVDFEGISFNDLKKQLDHLSVRDIRKSLTFLLEEGHIFTTVDDHHFKATIN